MPAILFASASSKKSFQGLFPPNRIRSISCALNASIVILLTKLICTPNPLCTPAQLRQIKTPNLGEAHCGDGAPQSQHLSFPLLFWISRSFCTLESAIDFVLIDHNLGSAEEQAYLGPSLRINLPHGFASHAATNVSSWRQFRVLIMRNRVCVVVEHSA